MKKKMMCLLVLLVICLFPATVWAGDVPEVTDEEYRYFLEDYAYNYLGENDYSQYNDKELQQLLKEAVESEEDDYGEMLEFILWDDYMFLEEDFGKHSDAELEKFMARAVSDDVYSMVVYMEEYSGITVPDCDSPQETSSAVYKALLKKDYNITEGLDHLQWYQLQDLYYRTGLQHDIQNEYGYTGDLSEYTYDELWELYDKLEMEAWLREDFRVTEDLSGYTAEELEDMWSRLDLEKTLREEYQVTKELSAYSLEELEQMEYRLELEKELREEYNVTEDLSGYTVEELQEMSWEQQNLQWEKEWALREEQARTKVDILINGKMMQYIDEAESSLLWGLTVIEEDAYVSDVRPVIKEERVYIPFRAVFEALGAEVSYDAETRTVMAQRGEKTVSFTAGEPQYVMNGVAIPMDAQTFVQDNRTYVPVRFASQALGAAVGWDADDRTVVILEKDKLLNRYKGQFTVLERYLQHWDLGEGNVALHGTVALDMMIRGEDVEVPVGLTMETAELTSADVMNMETAVKLDIEELVTLLKQAGDLDSETTKILEVMKEFRIQYILDIGKGRLYIQSDLMEFLEGDGEAWYCLDIRDYLNDAEYQQYKEMIPAILKKIEQQNLTEMDGFIALMVQNLDVTDYYDVQSTLEGLDLLLYAVGDKWLGKTGEGYQRIWNGEVYDVKLMFHENQKQIDGITISANLKDVYSDSGMKLRFVLEEQKHEIVFSLDGDISDYESSVTMNCEGKYVYQLTDEQPKTEPDAGSQIKDLAQLLETAGLL